MVVEEDDDWGWEQREWVYYKWAGDCSSEEFAGCMMMFVQMTIDC